MKRNPEGKEIRFETKLTDDEREIARRICMAFGQTICGFDMLRVNGKSYVIDVNGWSFVKGNPAYDELCAKVLRSIFVRVTPKYSRALLTEPSKGQWRLKGFIEVLRHADRTPKLKFKMTTAPEEFALIEGMEDQQERIRYALKQAQQMIAAGHEETGCLKRLVEILQQKGHLQSTKIQRRPTGDSKALLIVKWGGEFTHAGRHQAGELGEVTRKDLSILNKGVLGDVKFFCSAERRVQATADVFAKGLLKVAEVPENLVEIRRDILDHASVAKASIESVRKSLSAELNEFQRGPFIRILLEKFKDDLVRMRVIMKNNLANLSSTDLFQFQWCCSESPSLFQERWERHFADLLDTDKIEPARISDFYDSLKYDALHNLAFLKLMVRNGSDDEADSGEQLIRDLFDQTQRLFAYLSPKETGMTVEEKVNVGLEIIGPLLNTILSELEQCISGGHGRARFYFTKESHMVALMNVLMHAGLPLARRRTSSVLFPEELTCDPFWFGELDYLSQIGFELYEKEGSEGEGSSYSLRIGMSQGAHDLHLLDLHLDRRHCLSVAPKQWITRYLPAPDALRVMSSLIDRKQGPNH